MLVVTGSNLGQIAGYMDYTDKHNKMSQPSFVQRLLLFLSLGQVVRLHTLHVSAFTEPSSGVFIHETCHTAFVVTLFLLHR
jgi:hypothetical protein